MERTLIIVKPDGVQRGLVGEVIGRLEQRGLKIVALKMVKLDRAFGERHYGEHKGKPFFEGLVNFISSSPVVAGVLEGPDAVAITRTTMGATNPVSAAPGTIRADLGIDMGRNLIHGSDSVESAEREIGLFFSPDEVVSYDRAIDAWIIE